MLCYKQHYKLYLTAEGQEKGLIFLVESAFTNYSPLTHNIQSWESQLERTTIQDAIVSYELSLLGLKK